MPIEIQNVQSAMEQALIAGGHDGSRCALEAFTVAIGPSGAILSCRCGARMWTRDIARLMRFREIKQRVRACIEAAATLALDSADDREALISILCGSLVEDLP